MSKRIVNWVLFITCLLVDTPVAWGLGDDQLQRPTAMQPQAFDQPSAMAPVVGETTARAEAPTPYPAIQRRGERVPSTSIPEEERLLFLSRRAQTPAPAPLLIEPFEENLHRAVKEGRFETVKQLLDKSPPLINTKDESGNTALNLAIIFSRQSIVELLLQKDADVNIANNYLYTPLHLAVQNNSLFLVKLLLERDVNINATTSVGSTALHIAASSHNIEIVRELILKRANTTIVDNYGDIALHNACQNPCKGVIELLLGHMSNPNQVNNSGHTPFQYALVYFTNNRYSIEAACIVATLLEFGADVASEDISGHTPLHWASEVNSIALAKMLLEAGADVNQQQTVTGYTALHIASIKGFRTMIEYLLEKNANAGIKDKNNTTAQDYALIYSPHLSSLFEPKTEEGKLRKEIQKEEAEARLQLRSAFATPLCGLIEREQSRQARIREDELAAAPERKALALKKIVSPTCTICQEDFKLEESLVRLPCCSTAVHTECIKPIYTSHAQNVDLYRTDRWDTFEHPNPYPPAVKCPNCRHVLLDSSKRERKLAEEIL